METYIWSDKDFDHMVDGVRQTQAHTHKNKNQILFTSIANANAK